MASRGPLSRCRRLVTVFFLTCFGWAIQSLASGVGILVEVDGSVVEIDQGSRAGVEIGMSGVVLNTVSVGGVERGLQVARFTVVEVETDRCRAQLTETGKGWKIESSMEVSFESTLEPLAAPWGVLVVRSNVAGDSVFVNESPVGSTPVQLRLEAGSYEVRVAKNGWGPFVTNARVETLAQVNIDAKLVASGDAMKLDLPPVLAEVERGRKLLADGKAEEALRVFSGLRRRVADTTLFDDDERRAQEVVEMRQTEQRQRDEVAGNLDYYRLLVEKLAGDDIDAAIQYQRIIEEVTQDDKDLGRLRRLEFEKSVDLLPTGFLPQDIGEIEEEFPGLSVGLRAEAEANLESHNEEERRSRFEATGPLVFGDCRKPAATLVLAKYGGKVNPYSLSGKWKGLQTQINRRWINFQPPDLFDNLSKHRETWRNTCSGYKLGFRFDNGEILKSETVLPLGITIDNRLASDGETPSFLYTVLYFDRETVLRRDFKGYLQVPESGEFVTVVFPPVGQPWEEQPSLLLLIPESGLPLQAVMKNGQDIPFERGIRIEGMPWYENWRNSVQIGRTMRIARGGYFLISVMPIGEEDGIPVFDSVFWEIVLEREENRLRVSHDALELRVNEEVVLGRPITEFFEHSNRKIVHGGEK